MSAAPPFAPTRETSTLRLVLTLAGAGLLSGLILVTAYVVTLPRITANKEAALQRGIYAVVPGSQSTQRLVWDGEGKGFTPASGMGGKEPSVYAAYGPGGAFLGYAILGEGPGFQDAVRLIFGYDPVRKRIIGLQVLESRETPGLGDRINKDEGFLGSFKDLAVEPEVVAAKELTGAPNEVDAITGATISSKAVVKIVNTADAEWLHRLPPPGKEPPAPAGDAAGETPAGGRDDGTAEEGS